MYIEDLHTELDKLFSILLQLSTKLMKSLAESVPHVRSQQLMTMAFVSLKGDVTVSVLIV